MKNYKKFLELKEKLHKYAEGGKVQEKHDQKNLDQLKKSFEQFIKEEGQEYSKGGKAKLGSGERFKALEKTLSNKEGIKDPAALAASIGRKKYGNKKMEKMAHKSDGGYIDDEGQAQESQQKQYQAKDYFGKGSNGAGEGVANSMGVMMNDGGDVQPKVPEEKSFTLQVPEEYRQYLQSNKNPKQDSDDKASGKLFDMQGYADGGMVASPSANTASSLSPLLKESYAGPDKKKKPIKMATGGWTPEQVVKPPHPKGLPGVHNPLDPKMRLNIPRAPTINIPKRLKSISDIRGYADGGDIKHEDIQGPEQQVPASILESQYAPIEDAANQAANSAPDAQLQDVQNQQGLLAKIDAALGNKHQDDSQEQPLQTSEGEPVLNKEGVLEGMSDEEEPSKDEDLEKQYAKEEDKASPVDDSVNEKEAGRKPAAENKGAVPSPEAFNPIDALKQAQQNRDKIQMWNQLGAISDRMGAQMGNFAPTQQQTYKDNAAMAQQAVDDVKDRIKQQGDDPNSLLSQQFRSYLAKFGGEEVDPRTTANIGKEILPFAFKDFEAKQAEEARSDLQEQRSADLKYKYDQLTQMKKIAEADRAERLAETKTDKEKSAKEKLEATTSYQADQALFGARQPPDIKQARLDHYNAQKGMNSIDDFQTRLGDLNKVDKPMVDNIRAEVQKIAQSGAPTEGGLNKFDPNTWSGSLANAWQKMVNHPVGANAGEFLKEYKNYFQTMQNTAGPLIYNYNNSILNSKKRLMNPDDFKSKLESDYVQPYAKYAPNQAPKEAVPSVNKQVVRKGYNASTNQTQLIYNDGTSEIKDGKL